MHFHTREMLHVFELRLPWCSENTGGNKCPRCPDCTLFDWMNDSQDLRLLELFPVCRTLADNLGLRHCFYLNDWFLWMTRTNFKSICRCIGQVAKPTFRKKRFPTEKNVFWTLKKKKKVTEIWTAWSIKQTNYGELCRFFKGIRI